MARQFRQITARFWTGQTAVRMRKQHPTVRLVAIYLATAPTSHMTGLYYLTIPTIAGDLGITVRRVKSALAWLCDDGYCLWDDDNTIIWVKQMALQQMGLTLAPRDNRQTTILDQLREHKHSPLATLFVRHYWEAYCLAEVDGIAALGIELPGTPSAAPFHAPSAAPFQAPSEGPAQAPSEAPAEPLGDSLPSQRAENRDQGTENRDQARESERAESPAVSRARCAGEPGSLSGSPPSGATEALLSRADPLPSDHPEHEACIAALWAHQNQLRAGVDPSQPPVPADPDPGGNLNAVRSALAKYAPATLATALANTAIEAECKRELGEDPLEFFNGETNWRSAQLMRQLSTTPEAIRKRYRRKRRKKAANASSGALIGPAQPHAPQAYAGGRVEL